MLSQKEITAFLVRERINLTAFIAALTRDFHTAEDIYQELFVQAVGKSDPFQDTTHLLRWSRTVGRTRAINYLQRYRKRQLLLGDELLDLFQEHWPDHQQRDGGAMREALSSCLERLTPRSREIVRLRYFKALRGIDVAEQLKSKVDTIYKALARIHHQLRDCVRGQMVREGA